MKENQKDQQSTQNQGGQQNQDGQFNQNDQRKSGNPSSKPSSTGVENEEEEEDQQTVSEREHRDTEHQHDYKTPVGSPDRNNENREPGQSRNTTPGANKNQNANQG